MLQIAASALLADLEGKVASSTLMGLTEYYNQVLENYQRMIDWSTAVAGRTREENRQWLREHIEKLKSEGAGGDTDTNP